MAGSGETAWWSEDDESEDEEGQGGRGSKKNNKNKKRQRPSGANEPPARPRYVNRIGTTTRCSASCFPCNGLHAV